MSCRCHLFSKEDRKMCADLENAIHVRSRLALDNFCFHQEAGFEHRSLDTAALVIGHNSAE